MTGLRPYTWTCGYHKTCDKERPVRAAVPTSRFRLLPVSDPRHAWRNTSGREARVLVIFSPPVDYGYFEELDRLTRSASEGRPDLASLAAFAEQYGLT